MAEKRIFILTDLYFTFALRAGDDVKKFFFHIFCVIVSVDWQACSLPPEQGSDFMMRSHINGVKIISRKPDGFLHKIKPLCRCGIVGADLRVCPA